MKAFTASVQPPVIGESRGRRGCWRRLSTILRWHYSATCLFVARADGARASRVEREVLVMYDAPDLDYSGTFVTTDSVFTKQGLCNPLSVHTFPDLALASLDSLMFGNGVFILLFLLLPSYWLVCLHRAP